MKNERKRLILFCSNLPNTKQAVKTKPKQDKSFSFIFHRKTLIGWLIDWSHVLWDFWGESPRGRQYEASGDMFICVCPVGNRLILIKNEQTNKQNTNKKEKIHINKNKRVLTCQSKSHVLSDFFLCVCFLLLFFVVVCLFVFRSKCRKKERKKQRKRSNKLLKRYI